VNVTRLRLQAGKVSLELELRDCATTRALAAAAPFDAQAQTWGDELYFSTPVSAKLEADARQVVEPGTVCFWTQGDALALPWGPTPISTDGKPKLANPCSVLGRVLDFSLLKKIKPGDRIKVTLA
jgi:uncharacterized protein